MRRPELALLLWMTMSLLAACGDEPVKPDAETAPTLVDIQAQLLTPSCSFEACHGGLNPKQGLDLSTVDASMASLVGVAGVEPGTTRVVAGDPDASLLVQVLEGQVGATRQMPPGFPMDATMMTMVREWIATGALRGEGQGRAFEGEDDPAQVDGPTPDELPPPDPGEGFQMGIDTVAPAGSEIWKCQVADLPGRGLVAVNRVESLQTPGVHHMDVMALGLLSLPIEPGMYECDELYDTYIEMMEDGIFLFASQNTEESLLLPEGVAAVIPGNLRVMIEMHYVNPTPRPVPVWSRINAYTVPMAQVQDQIWGSAVRDVDINIPAGTEDHVEWSRCVLNRDVEMILLSSHTHQLARRVDVYAFDGQQRGELLYSNDDWHAPELKQFPVPVAIPAGQGFEFQCHYANATDAEVHWGFTADDEMCQIAFVHTPFDTQAACEVIDSGGGPLATLPAQ